MQLSPDECRVLGTLIEKALTTPGQYPLSLNSLVTGVNQKSNRDPVVEIDEMRALRAIDGLRAKGLVRDVTFTGSRVEKYRHTVGEALELRPPESALLAELLLRGPQTVGELRGRASRMQPFESLEAVEGALATLAERAAPMSPLVREIPALPGSRAPRWMQLLCESLHPLGQGPAPSRDEVAMTGDVGELAELRARVASLESEVADLRSAVAELRGLVT